MDPKIPSVLQNPKGVSLIMFMIAIEWNCDKKVN